MHKEHRSQKFDYVLRAFMLYWVLNATGTWFWCRPFFWKYSSRLASWMFSNSLASLQLKSKELSSHICFIGKTFHLCKTYDIICLIRSSTAGSLFKSTNVLMVSSLPSSWFSGAAGADLLRPQPILCEMFEMYQMLNLAIKCHVVTM